MKPHEILTWLAIASAIIEILSWKILGYEYPIPIYGFIFGCLASMSYASYKSRPHKED
jgi:hypothetical protein